MEITKDTTVGELMDLLTNSKEDLSRFFEDPMPSFKLFGDGSFQIDEEFYGASATCNSNTKINNNFTGHSISKIIENRLST